MIIDPLEGDREVIEKTLDEYGLVVTGKMTPEEFPQDEIFIVPVRLEDCNPADEILNELHIIDLHKGGYNSGLQKIIKTLQ